MDHPRACILAGGKSRRFGSDKTLLRQDGRLLVERLSAQLHTAGFHVTLLTNGATHLAGIGDAVLHDCTPHAGPLHTIYHAFCQLSCDRCLVVAADMPFLAPTVARLLWTTGATASITHLEGSHLPGVYARTLAPQMKALLCRDERRLQTLLLQVAPDERQIIPATEWRPLDPKGHALININTPEDWQTVATNTPSFS